MRIVVRVQGAKAGKVTEWAAAQGVEATEEELFAYAKSAVAESGELTDEQLEKVAGGGYGTFVTSYIGTWMTGGCGDWAPRIPLQVGWLG